MPWRAFAATFPLVTAAKLRRKPCRRVVRGKLAALAEAQTYGDETGKLAEAIADACRECGRCPKFTASISFMRPASAATPRLR